MNRLKLTMLLFLRKAMYGTLGSFTRVLAHKMHVSPPPRSLKTTNATTLVLAREKARVIVKFLDIAILELAVIHAPLQTLNDSPFALSFMDICSREVLRTWRNSITVKLLIGGSYCKYNVRVMALFKQRDK